MKKIWTFVVMLSVSCSTSPRPVGVFECSNDSECPFVVSTSVSCSSAQCVYRCLDEFADCDGDLEKAPQSNGCEVALVSEVGCGGCGNTCDSSQYCDPNKRICADHKSLSYFQYPAPNASNPRTTDVDMMVSAPYVYLRLNDSSCSLGRLNLNLEEASSDDVKQFQEPSCSGFYRTVDGKLALQVGPWFNWSDIAFISTSTGAVEKVPTTVAGSEIVEILDRETLLTYPAGQILKTRVSGEEIWHTVAFSSGVRAIVNPQSLTLFGSLSTDQNIDLGGSSLIGTESQRHFFATFALDTGALQQAQRLYVPLSEMDVLAQVDPNILVIGGASDDIASLYAVDTASGKVMWRQSATEGSSVTALVPTTNGAYFAGVFYQQLKFGSSRLLNNMGKGDVFVGHVSKNGAISQLFSIAGTQHDRISRLQIGSDNKLYILIESKSSDLHWADQTIAVGLEFPAGSGSMLPGFIILQHTVN